MGPRAHADRWLILANREFFKCAHVHRGIPEAWFARYFSGHHDVKGSWISAQVTRSNSDRQPHNLNAWIKTEGLSEAHANRMTDFNGCANVRQPRAGMQRRESWAEA